MIDTKTLKQLLRQPGRTAAGCVMIGLAVAALILCFGQNVAADRAQTQMEESFRTAALLTDELQFRIKTMELPSQTFTDQRGNTVEVPGELIEYQERIPLMPEEISQWVIELPERYPELVENVADHGLLSAYIPELIPDVYASYEPEVPMTFWDGKISTTRSAGVEPTPFGTPYDYGMFQITLTKIGEPEEVTVTDPETGENTEVLGVKMILEGTVDRIIALQQGYPDCLGFTVHLYLNLPDMETVDALDLELGGSYLVYGTHYYDLDWVLRHQIMDYYREKEKREIGLDAFDPENLRLYDQSILDKYVSYGQSVYSVGYYVHNGDIISFDNREYAMFRKVYLDLDWAENHGNDPETLERYAVPNLVRIDGSVEEFMESDEGTLWNESLENLNITSRSFPVLAVEDVQNVGEFIRGSARIVKGRTFTAQEAMAGEKLCVISEQVAAASGLSVGDTITLRPYQEDRENPYQSYVEDGCGITNPAAYRFGRTTPFTGEAESYTIVGLYRYDGAWASVEDNLYAITPNTVFVPKASVTGELIHSDQGTFRTVVLRNEALRDFMAVADEAGYEDLFVYYDQGYNDVAQSISEYRIMAGRAMIVGGIIYGIILLLYLILFPAGLEQNLILMDSMGATRMERMGHVALSSLGILAVGTLLGCIGGALLWNRVVEELTRSAEVTLELSLDLLGFVEIGGGQLLLAMGLILLLAYWMTRPRTLAGRK